MTIKEEVLEIISSRLGLDPSEVTPEKSIIGDLNADSLDVTELVMSFEERFGLKYKFEISDEEAEALKTVQDVIDYLEKKKVEFEDEQNKDPV